MTRIYTSKQMTCLIPFWRIYLQRPIDIWEALIFTLYIQIYTIGMLTVAFVFFRIQRKSSWIHALKSWNRYLQWRLVQSIELYWMWLKIDEVSSPYVVGVRINLANSGKFEYKKLRLKRIIADGCFNRVLLALKNIKWFLGNFRRALICTERVTLVCLNSIWTWTAHRMIEC